MDTLQTKIETIVNNELDKISKTLITRCQEAVAEAFSAFSAELVNRCGIEASVIEEIWNSKIPINITKSTSNSKPVKNKDTPTDGCTAILQRGKNAGQKCGSRPKNGGNYCSRHAHLEQKEDSTTTDTKSNSKRKETASGKNETQSHPKPTLRYNTEIRHFVHSETGLVLDADRKTIIGRYIDNEIHHLSTDDIVNAEKHGFKIGKPVVQNESTNKPIKSMAEKIKKLHKNDKEKLAEEEVEEVEDGDIEIEEEGEIEEEEEDGEIEEEDEEMEEEDVIEVKKTVDYPRHSKLSENKSAKKKSRESRANVESLGSVKRKVERSLGDSRTEEVKEVLTMFGHDISSEEELEEE